MKLHTKLWYRLFFSKLQCRHCDSSQNHQIASYFIFGLQQFCTCIQLFITFDYLTERQVSMRMRNWLILLVVRFLLPYDVASGSEITPCNKIDKPLVVYRNTGNVMTSVTTLSIYCQNYNVFTAEMRFQSICHLINRIYHSCSCIIEFIKLVAKKEIKCSASLAFFLFFPNSFNKFNKT